MTLTEDELKILELGKESNPHYFKSLIHGVEVMADRVKKYSGKDDPYQNFIIFSRAKGIPVNECFVDYELIKWARNLVATGDFEDESSMDTESDLGNYANIAGGWLTRSPFERVQAQLRCGRWVCWDDVMEANLINRQTIWDEVDKKK